MPAEITTNSTWFCNGMTFTNWVRWWKAAPGKLSTWILGCEKEGIWIAYKYQRLLNCQRPNGIRPGVSDWTKLWWDPHRHLSITLRKRSGLRLRPCIGLVIDLWRGFIIPALFPSDSLVLLGLRGGPATSSKPGGEGIITSITTLVGVLVQGSFFNNTVGVTGLSWPWFIRFPFLERSPKAWVISTSEGSCVGTSEGG